MNNGTNDSSHATLAEADAAAAAPTGGRRQKGEETLAAVIDTALQMAVTDGLQSVSFGEVAKRLDISKSAVFFHTGSLRALQRLVLDEYDRRFSDEIFAPALAAERGLPRLEAIVDKWLECSSEGRAINGSIFAVGAFDMHSRVNPMHQRLLESVVRWRVVLERSINQAVDMGHLRADTDAAEFAYIISSLLIGLMHDRRFMGDERAVAHARSAYKRLLSTYKVVG